MKTNEVKVINTEEAPGKGRPTMYRNEYAEQAFKLALLGATDAEIANFFNVSRSTFALWKKQMVHFSDTVKKGKMYADANVAASLYKRAVGYEYESEKLMTVAKGDGISEVERHSIIIHVIPDAGAALNWLKNRQPALWRDKQDVSLSGEISVTLNLDGEVKQIESAE